MCSTNPTNFCLQRFRRIATLWLIVKPQAPFMRISSRTVIAMAAAGLPAAVVQSLFASVDYTTPGSFYTQDFNTLPNTPQNVSLGTTAAGVGWTDDSASPGASQFSIVGWYLYHPIVQAEGGVNGHQRVRIGAGTVNTGSFMSFGASGSTERALGDIGSNTLADAPGGYSDIYLGIRLHNNTGQALNSFTVSYDGEQWRDGGSGGGTPVAQTMSFMYSTIATSISDTNTLFTTVTALNFTSPVFANTGSGAGVDGNGAGLVAGISATVTGIDWQPGTDLWLRWDDPNNTGNDHGLAIDNFSFSATVVPEPSALVLGGVGLAALLLLRRRK